jgi:hypothetical protein
LSEDGGGSYSRSDDSERLARIETAVEFMREDLHELRVDVRDVRDRMIRLEGTVATLPTKTWAMSAVLVVLSVMTALIAFQEQIRVYLGTN